MQAYAIAHMRDVDWGPAIIAYLQKITDSLKAHGGRFLVHGNNPSVMDGKFEGHMVVIEFPNMERARDWYFSCAYQNILPMRLRNACSSLVLVEGVGSGYQASELLARF